MVKGPNVLAGSVQETQHREACSRSIFDQRRVSIAIPLSDCNDTFTFKGPISKANVTWNFTLSTPVQLSPANGTVFNNYPRTTTLQWLAVPGAASYTVQVYYQPGDTTCTGGTQDYLTLNLTGTSYTFDFVGAQPGCWRV